MDSKLIGSPSPEFLQATLDSLDSHIAILNSEGVIVAVNAAWRHFGLQNGLEDSIDGVGVNYLQLCEQAHGLNSEEAPLVARGLRKLFRGDDERFEVEYPCHSPSEWRWFVLRATSFLYEDRRWVTIAHENITLQKETELQLELIRQAVEETQEGITIADFNQPDRPIIYVNQAFTEITGYHEREVLGKNCRFLQGSETNQESIEQIRRALSEEAPCRVELLNYRKDGTPFWNQLSLAPLKNSFGHVTHYVGVQMETTEKKMLEQELQSLNANKDKLFSVISHDLKSPFHSILGFSEILSGDLRGFTPEELRSYGEHIHTGARNLLSLIDNLMQWTRLQSGRLGYAPEPLMLADIVERSFDLVRGNAMRKEITLENHLPRTLQAFADNTMLSLVLQNLLSNSVKFTHMGGAIQVTASEEGPWIRLHVEDNGVGISPERQEKLFNLEDTVSSLGTANEKGTGLGLVLCRELVEMNGGRIELESDAGSGTRITLVLPTERFQDC